MNLESFSSINIGISMRQLLGVLGDLECDTHMSPLGSHKNVPSDPTLKASWQLIIISASRHRHHLRGSRVHYSYCYVIGDIIRGVYVRFIMKNH